MPVTEIFERHGATIRQNTCRCPFHADDTPSLSIYAGGTKWHCFGCNEGGNVIDALMLFEDLSFMDALKRFDEDYRLNLFADVTKTVPQRRRVSIYAWAAQKQKEYRQTRLDALEGYYYYDAMLRKYSAPVFRSKEEEREFWEAVRLRQECERVYEELADIKI